MTTDKQLVDAILSLHKYMFAARDVPGDVADSLGIIVGRAMSTLQQPEYTRLMDHLLKLVQEFVAKEANGK